MRAVQRFKLRPEGQRDLSAGVLPGERPSRQVSGLAPGVPRGVLWIAWALRCRSRRACASAADQSTGVATEGFWLRRCCLRAMSHCPCRSIGSLMRRSESLLPDARALSAPPTQKAPDPAGWGAFLRDLAMEALTTATTPTRADRRRPFSRSIARFDTSRQAPSIREPHITSSRKTIASYRQNPGRRAGVSRGSGGFVPLAPPAVEKSSAPGGRQVGVPGRETVSDE